MSNFDQPGKTTKSYFKANENLFVPIDYYFPDISSCDVVMGSDLQDLQLRDDLNNCECKGPVVYEVKKFKLIDCCECGHIHVAPLPTSFELSEFYETQFYNQERKSDYFSKQKAQAEWWNRIFDERLARLEQILGRQGKILDVGCGAGFFLDRAKARGWQVFGIEPARDAAKYARDELGLEVVVDSVENIQGLMGSSSIDVVYSHGVIEHLREPLKFLNDAYQMLKPGEGIIFTSAANDFSLYQGAAVRSLNIYPWWIIPPEHLNYFTVRSLCSVHERIGFTTKDLRTSFPIDQFLLMGVNYVARPELGSVAHKNRTQYEDALVNNGLSALLGQIQISNAKLGIGRQTEFVGVVS